MSTESDAKQAVERAMKGVDLTALNSIAASSYPIMTASVEVMAFLRDLCVDLAAEEQDKAFAGFPHEPSTSPEEMMALAHEGLRRVTTGTMPIDKLNRWIGFIQGVLASRGQLKVQEERDRTRPIFEAAYKAAGIAGPINFSQALLDRDAAVKEEGSDTGD